MSNAVRWSKDKVDSLQIDLPVHPLFRNRLGDVVERLTVVKYVGKDDKDKHLWACTCSCGSTDDDYVILTSTGLCTTKSCGCYKLERIRIANIGNNRKPIAPLQPKIDYLKTVRPEYQVLDAGEGRVMENWKFHCSLCGIDFWARYDNVIPHPSTKAQKACACKRTSGYDSHIEGIFYIFDCGEYIKYGITNHLERRWLQLERSAQIPYEIALSWKFKDGRFPRSIENIFSFVFNANIDKNISGKTETCYGATEREYLSLFYYLKDMSLEDGRLLLKVFQSMKKREDYMKRRKIVG